MESWPIEGDLHAYRNVPPDPRAAVLLLHGFGEHAGRHAATAAALARRGIAVYSYDHRGHGASPGARALVSDFDAWVDEARTMRDRVAAEQPGRPLFLMGASMGGLMAVRSAQRDPEGLAGVVLISPALDLSASAPPVVRALGAVIGRVAPAAPVATLELEALSRDPAVAAAYAADPLTHHGKVPARTGRRAACRRCGGDGGGSPVAAARLYHRWRCRPYRAGRRNAAVRRSRPRRGRRRDAADRPGRLPRAAHGSRRRTVDRRDGRVDYRSSKSPARCRRRRAGRPRGRASRLHVAGRARVRRGGERGRAAAGTNTGRYGELVRPWFAPPGWVFPIAWGINSTLSIWGNLRVLNGPPSDDRSAYLRLWAGTWLLYTLFGYAFFRRRSPLLGLLVTVNFLVLSVLSASRALRIDRDLWKTYVTLLPWLVLATAVAGSVALENPDPLLDPPDTPGL